MSKKLPGRYISENAVKRALKIDSFRNLSKDKIMQFALESRRLIRRGIYRKRMNLGKIFIRNDIAGNSVLVTVRERE